MGEGAAGLAVYIVDDDAAIRDALSLLLSLHGYRTASFASGETCSARWTREAPGASSPTSRCRA